MEDDQEELIRRRAYEIWEREGKPAGDDMQHWLQAWHELEEANGEIHRTADAVQGEAVKNVDVPKPASARKKSTSSITGQSRRKL
jgi:hypothetical protein